MRSQIASPGTWADRRAAVALKDGVANLNAGTCSPTLKTVLAEQIELTRRQAEDPVEFTFRWAPERMESERQILARFVGAPAKDILLTNNTTYAVNAVAKSLSLKAGDEILMSDQEYVHYLPLWDDVAKQYGASVKTARLPLAADDASPARIVQAFAEVITARTRVLFLSHVTSACGMVLPVREICALAKEKGAVTIVDGAHALGLVPTRVADLHADFYTANVHKWPMGATGSAFLYVHPDARRLLKPLVTTATSRYAETKADHPVWRNAPSHWAFSHEYQGTRNLIPHLVMSKAIRYHEELGFDAIHARTRELTAAARRDMAAFGFVPASPEHPEIATCMTAWHWPKTRSGIL